MEASAGETSLSEESLDAMIKTALDCPCVQDLREGPCGQVFAAAFTCFHKSKAVPKGYDCFEANLLFAECLQHHPTALDSFQPKSGAGAGAAAAAAKKASSPTPLATPSVQSL